MNATSTLPPAAPARSILISPQLRSAARLAWDAIERFGHRRAAAHLRLLAIQHGHSDPALAEHLRAAATACAASGRTAPGVL